MIGIKLLILLNFAKRNVSFAKAIGRITDEENMASFIQYKRHNKATRIVILVDAFENYSSDEDFCELLHRADINVVVVMTCRRHKTDEIEKQDQTVLWKIVRCEGLRLDNVNEFVKSKMRNKVKNADEKFISTASKEIQSNLGDLSSVPLFSLMACQLYNISTSEVATTNTFSKYSVVNKFLSLAVNKVKKPKPKQTRVDKEGTLFYHTLAWFAIKKNVLKHVNLYDLRVTKKDRKLEFIFDSCGKVDVPIMKQSEMLEIAIPAGLISSYDSSNGEVMKERRREYKFFHNIIAEFAIANLLLSSGAYKIVAKFGESDWYEILYFLLMSKVNEPEDVEFWNCQLELQIQNSKCRWQFLIASQFFVPFR